MWPTGHSGTCGLQGTQGQGPALAHKCCAGPRLLWDEVPQTAMHDTGFGAGTGNLSFVFGSGGSSWPPRGIAPRQPRDLPVQHVFSFLASS